MKRIFSVLAMLCPFLSMCQPITIKGKIINEQMEPIAGATITVKATGKATTANDKGEFTLPGIRLLDTLIVSAVGYETEEVPNNERGLHTVILRRKATALQEVTVSTGYQALPKERATGSFATIDNRQLSLQMSTGIIERLNGVASSMLFESKLDGPPYTVRGLSTIQGPKAPLIILDNFPYEGDVNNINPADVESVTLLKDAAAASIWGTRAGNGVLVITSKKGSLNQPLRIAVSSNIVVTEKPDLFALPQMSSSDFIDVEGFLFGKNYYNAQINNAQKPALSPVVELLVKKKSGQLSAAEADAQIDALRLHDIRHDYLQHFYRPALHQQYAVNLQGGGPAIGYYIGLGADKNRSDLDAGYERYSLRLQNTFRPSQRWQMGLTMLYTQTGSSSGKPGWNSVTAGSRRVPYLRFTNPDGSPAAIAKDLREGYTDTAGGGSLLDWKYYPLEDYKHHTTRGASYNLLGVVHVQYKPVSFLSLDVNYQLQQSWGESRELEGEESYAARDRVNRYTQLDRTMGTVKYIIPPGAVLEQSQSRMVTHNLRSQLNINKTISRHNIAVIAGTELREVHNSAGSNTIYGYNPEVITYANIDFTGRYPSFINGGLSSIPNGLGFSETLNRFVSLYTNGAYTFNERYTLSASARKDASNLFGVHTNEKWNPLWSAGASWQISKERFYRLAALPYLRLRTSFGFSGNVDQSKSAVTTLVYTGSASFTNLPSAQVNQFPDPDLRWERVQTLNIGFDFAGRDQRWSGSIEYYRKKGLDLFGTTLIDYTAGLNRNFLIKNVANMEGTGVDLVLETLLKKGVWAWNTTLLFNYNMAKTTRYYRSTILARTFVSDGRTISPLEGKPLYAVISYPWAGLDPANGNPQGYLEGTISTAYNTITGAGTKPADLIYSGPALPRYFGSLLNSFSWKNLTLTANLQYKLGYYFRKPSIAYGTLYSAGISHSDYGRRWQKPGDEAWTNVPSLAYPLASNRDAFYLSSEATVAKADHIRLQFISLEYLWKMESRRWPVKNLHLQLNVANLGIIWRANKEGIDPDYASSIPSAKSFAFGFKTEF